MNDCKCERCNYDEVTRETPDAFANYYAGVCDACYKALCRVQENLEDWGRD